jgi:hypothetical protein
METMAIHPEFRIREVTDAIFDSNLFRSGAPRKQGSFSSQCVFTLTFLGLDERHLGSLFAPIRLFTRLKHLA